MKSFVGDDAYEFKYIRTDSLIESFDNIKLNKAFLLTERNLLRILNRTYQKISLGISC